jgi:DNA anti-recombination protein RmuC
MYIPAESIFHEVAAGVDEEGGSLAEFALRHRIIPVSPNTLHAYLAVVRLGLRGFRLQENARRIVRHLEHLQKDVEGLRSGLDTAIRQARHSLGNLSGVDDSLSRVEGRLQNLSRVGAPDEPEVA